MSHGSPLNINYQELESLLSNGQWQQADQKTNQILEQLEKIERAKRKSVREDIQIIDKIWMQYSGQRFSFTKQSEIYRNCGGSSDFSYTRSLYDRCNEQDRNAFQEFCKQVGWYDGFGALRGHPGAGKITFSIDAPVGHLPSFAKRTRLKLGIMDAVDTGEPVWDWGDIIQRLN